MTAQTTNKTLEDTHSGDGVGGLPMAVRRLQAFLFLAREAGRGKALFFFQDVVEQGVWRRRMDELG